VRWAILTGLFFSVCLAGCRPEPIPNPNDPAQVELMRAEVILRNLRYASDTANMRVQRGEITEEEAKRLVSEYARKLTDAVELERIPAEEAWQYGEAFRAARNWTAARAALEVAVQHAPNEDRRINDTLRLAHVLAELGEERQAIETARTAFDAGPHDSAPILPATLLEIVPAAEGKGIDAELARLLEDAIALHEDTMVDPESEAGKLFLFARPHHIASAWTKVIELYQAAGEDELAKQAVERATRSMESRARA
jgi:tetratricopeptide (TPR) repeat protein